MNKRTGESGRSVAVFEADFAPRFSFAYDLKGDGKTVYSRWIWHLL